MSEYPYTRSQQIRYFFISLSRRFKDVSLNELLQRLSCDYAFDSNFRLIVANISRSIRNGMSLTEAMRETKMFTEGDVNLIQAFEKSFADCRLLDILAEISSTAAQYDIFWRAFSLGLEAGQTVAYEMVSEVVGDPLRQAVQTLCAKVKEGYPLSEAMAFSGAFSPVEIEQIATGEHCPRGIWLPIGILATKAKEGT